MLIPALFSQTLYPRIGSNILTFPVGPQRLETQCTLAVDSGCLDGGFIPAPCPRRASCCSSHTTCSPLSEPSVLFLCTVWFFPMSLLPASTPLLTQWSPQPWMSPAPGIQDSSGLNDGPQKIHSCPNPPNDVNVTYSEKKSLLI